MDSREADAIYLASRPAWSDGEQEEDDDDASVLRGDLREHVARSNSLLVAALPRSCGATPRSRDYLKAMTPALEARGVAVLILDDEVLYGYQELTHAQVWMRGVFGEVLTPSVAYFEEGELRDYRVGSTSDVRDEVALAHLLARNRLIDEDLGYVRDEETGRAQRFEAMRAMMRRNGSRSADARDFSGESLRGEDLSRLRLHGTLFRGADLSGASFRDASLLHADLCGALNAEQADFQGAIWGDQARCPDGTMSAAHVQSCGGHMRGEGASCER